jgi:hypothetical protein
MAKLPQAAVRHGKNGHNITFPEDGQTKIAHAGWIR